LIPILFNDANLPAKVESIELMIVSNNVMGGCRLFCLRSEFVCKKRGKSRKTKIRVSRLGNPELLSRWVTL
jgi:hypothetical protein